MEKSLKLVFVLLSFVVPVSTAFAASGRLSFGLQGGFTLTNHWSTKEKSGNYTVESSIKDSYTGGLIGVVQLSRVFSLEADLFFVKKGSNQSISVPGFPFGDIKVTYYLDYLEIPFLLRTHPFPRARIQFTTAVGPYVSFLLNQKYSYRIAVLGTEEREIQDIGSTDYGIVFGSGLSIPANVITLRLDYRYSMGFVDLKLPTGPGFPEIELRNYCHCLMLGIIF